jgi:hypothetical protein
MQAPFTIKISFPLDIYPIVGQLDHMGILVVGGGVPFVFETRSCCIAQAGLKHLGSSDPPTSTPQVAGTTGA